MIAAKQRPEISYASSQGNDSEEAQDTMNLKRAGLVLNLNTTVRISEATVMKVEGSQSLHSWLRKLPFLLIALQLTVIYIPIVTYSRIFTAKNSYLSR